MTSPTIHAPRLSPRATTGLAVATLLLGGVVAATALGGVGASDDGPRPSAEPVTSTVHHQSADAAERWTSPISSPVAQTSAAAALDRHFADVDQDVTTCRGGSVDAIERCLSD